MPASDCFFCNALVRPKDRHCASCGADSPVLPVGPEAASFRLRARYRWFALAAVGLFAVTAVGVQAASFDDAAPQSSTENAVAAIPPPPLDPIAAADWRQGESALRLALGDPDYQGFDESFISRSADRVVSLCGTLQGRGADLGRYVAVLGPRTATVIEAQDSTFEVLWNRACSS